MADRYRPRQRQPDLFETVLLTLGKGLWYLVSLPFKGLRKKSISTLNRQLYTGHWEHIETLAKASDSEHHKQAIMEADKLVDKALRELRFSGETMGERLRAAEHKFDRETYNNLWEAHKLRNQLAHEVGHRVSKFETDKFLAYFQDALRQLGAI